MKLSYTTQSNIFCTPDFCGLRFILIMLPNHSFILLILILYLLCAKDYGRDKATYDISLTYLFVKLVKVNPWQLQVMIERLSLLTGRT